MEDGSKKTLYKMRFHVCVKGYCEASRLLALNFHVLAVKFFQHPLSAELPTPHFHLLTSHFPLPSSNFHLPSTNS
jgi:hypothetical protein